jgi:hypothetical protein
MQGSAVVDIVRGGAEERVDELESKTTRLITLSTPSPRGQVGYRT